MLRAGIALAKATENIRVALFHPSLIAGGIQRVFVNLARGFLERGLAVDMVQATPEGGFRHAVPEGVRLIDLNAGRALTSLPGVVRYLRREQPRVLISGAIQTNLVAVWARRIAGVPVRLILTEHNIITTITADAPMVRTRMTPFFVRRFYPWADEIVAVSEGAAQDLAATIGSCTPTIRVIYNPIISPDIWQKAEEPLNDQRLNDDSRPMILAVGRLHYHKDYATLLRAFAILRRSLDVKLVFLGEGEERGRLEALTRELELSTAVSFLGDVANPLPYMRRAKVLALSSMVEALPTVLIEALAMNLPVVATDCPTGPREILRDGAYGTLVAIGDSSSMALALLNVLRGQDVPLVPPEALDRFQHDRVIEQYMAIMRIDTPVHLNPASWQSETPR
jgi:glycosyltransferase involved in cell wall biosynthesis